MTIFAAIQVQFERNGKTVEKVIHGLRHANCWETMAALGIPAERKEVKFFPFRKSKTSIKMQRTALVN